jgi:hypothetical protein
MRLVLVLIALSACNKSAPPPPGEPPRPAAGKPAGEPPVLPIDWANKREFTVRGRPYKGSILIFEGTYQVTVEKFPSGTRWTVGEDGGIIDSSLYSIIKVKDVQDRFAALPATKLREATIDPQATLALMLPRDEAAVVINLPPADAAYSVQEMLKKISDGPVVFPGEPPDTKPRENVLFLSGLEPKLFGRATVMSDIDQLALAELLPDVKGTKTCGGYRSNSGAPMPPLTLELHDSEATIYDRRTGDIVTKKTFPPDDHCPMFTFRARGENTQKSYVPRDKVEAWLRTQFKR